MTDHENPEPQPPAAPEPGAAGEASELVAVTAALVAVPDPPPDRLEHAVRAAIAAYDEVHGSPASGDGERGGIHSDKAMSPLPRRHNGNAPTHRRLAAVAAALVLLAGLTGLLVARNPLRSKVDDTAVMSQEAALDLRATTTVASRTAPGAPSPAAASPAPTTTAPGGALGPSAVVAAEPALGTYADPAPLLARVRAEATAPMIADAAAAGATAAEDSNSLQGNSGSVCGAPGGTPLGDAVIGATRVLVLLEAASSRTPEGTSGATSDRTSTRIRVYVAADCGLLLDEPLTG